MDGVFFIIIPNRRARVNNRNASSRTRKGEFIAVFAIRQRLPMSLSSDACCLIIISKREAFP